MQEERKDHGWLLEVRVWRRQARHEAPQDWHAQERQKRQETVKSKKQAIAIGLSEARAKGKKVLEQEIRVSAGSAV